MDRGPLPTRNASFRCETGVFVSAFRSATGARPRSRRKRLLLTATCGICAIVVAATLIYLDSRTFPAGGELEFEGGSYGWHDAKDVGTIFTDGLNIVNIADLGDSPLRLISARPLMDEGPTLRVLGVLARIVPDMLPPNAEVGGFQQAEGFPPNQPHTTGAQPVENLVVYPSKPGEKRWIELQIGYEVVAPGRSARRGVELTYEYQGKIHKGVIQSYLAICAPSTVTCAPESDQ